MEINIKLKDNQFEFKYSLGENQSGKASCPMSIDSLAMFVKLCDIALRTVDKSYEKKFKEIGLRALIEQDPDLVKKWVKENDERNTQ